MCYESIVGQPSVALGRKFKTSVNDKHVRYVPAHSIAVVPQESVYGRDKVASPLTDNMLAGVN